MYIPEWEIENAIVWNPTLVAISGRLEKLSLIENQKYLKNTGRYIDLLFKSDDKFVIVEVKCTYINEPAIVFDQVLEYKKELSLELGIPEEKIICSLVSPVGFSEEVLNLCNNLGIFTKKLDENDIINSMPQKISKNNDINILTLNRILAKRRSSRFETQNPDSIRGDTIPLKAMESVKNWINSGMHDESAKKDVARLFKKISDDAPIRAHEVSTNSNGRLKNEYDMWFWLFYSVLDRRSNAATFVKAKEALERKNLFLPNEITKLLMEKGDKSVLIKINKILKQNNFPLLRDHSYGDLAFPKSILDAANFMHKFNYDFNSFYEFHLDATDGDLNKAYYSLRKNLEDEIYGVGPRIASQFIRGMVLKGPWKLPLTDDKLLEKCGFNVRFAGKTRLGLIESEDSYYQDLGEFANDYLNGNRAIISHALWYIRKRYCDQKIICDDCRVAGYCNYFKKLQDTSAEKDLSWFTF